MSRIIWHQSDRKFEDGVDQGIIFPSSGGGIPWYGLVRVEEMPESAPVESYFIDGAMVDRSNPVEDFSAIVEAYTYPDELDDPDFLFGFSYRSLDDSGRYILHLIYQATVEVPEESLSTLSDRIDPSHFVWKLDAAPVRVPRVRPFAHIQLDSALLHPLQLWTIENHLYGTGLTEPAMPSPEWIVELLGTWTFGFGHGPFGHLPFGGHTS